MKRLIFLTILFSFIACNESASKKINSDVSQTQVSEDRKYAEITFDRIFHDFGNINEGQIVKTFFTFTNTSQNDLYIVDARGSCGCTVPECPKEPILPGETGIIKVNYDEKRVGSFNKSITITSNAKNSPKIIKVKGKIIAAEKNTNGSPIKKQSNLVPKAN